MGAYICEAWQQSKAIDESNGASFEPIPDAEKGRSSDLACDIIHLQDEMYLGQEDNGLNVNSYILTLYAQTGRRVMRRQQSGYKPSGHSFSRYQGCRHSYA
jgi:hypothetical protein